MSSLKDGGNIFKNMFQTQRGRDIERAYKKELQARIGELQTRLIPLKNNDALTAPEEGQLKAFEQEVIDLQKRLGGKSRKSKRRKSSKKSRKSVRRR